MSEYQKQYKQQYYRENKIVSFPLKNPYFEELKRRSILYDISTNTYAKNLVTNSLNQDTISLISNEKKEYISKYIHISRGIANNINQIAHKTNIESTVDIKVLIKSLQHYEDEFKKFINNI
ncbi:plasmid mobilization relaxosome protein MobC [Arcobacter sp.]|uniref:plasmid mobilization relaxosome protein MobC n=1 Tax=Arcobacter sp. TaxID=1872629 RepID=UPI003D10D056